MRGDGATRRLVAVLAGAAGVITFQIARRRGKPGFHSTLIQERESRRALESAESTLRAVVEASPLAIVSLDVKGNVTSWNPAAERTFGWTRSEVLGKPSPTVPPESRTESDEVRQEILHGHAMTALERRRKRKDGTEIDISISSAAIHDADGHPTGTVLIAEDITDRKRHEEEREVLLDREHQAREEAELARLRFEFLAEAGSVLASSLDYLTTLVSVSRLAVPHIADWCAVDIVEEDGSVRQLAAAHIDPEKTRMAEELAQEYPFDPNAQAGAPLVLRTGRPEIMTEIPDELLERVSPDERVLHILRELGLKSSMIVPMMARGRILGVITFVSAESGRRYGHDDLSLAMELAVRAALAVDNARLHRAEVQVAAQRAAILEQIVDAIVIADASGRTTFINGAARMITGVSAIGCPLEELARALHLQGTDGVELPTTHLPLARAILEGATVLDQELRIARPDRGEIFIQAGAAPIVTQEGIRLGGVMSFRDVTMQRMLERQKDDFLSAAAHDLKNPLATLKTMAQMLRKRVTRAGNLETANLVEGLERIDVTATRMAAMINELLDVTRLEMGRPIELELRQVDMVNLTRELVEDLRRTVERHELQLEACASEVVGEWDGPRLERVIGNLLSNAIKFSPEGGEVSVRVTNEGDWAVITVQDQGIGIPEQDLPHVFDRFFRARNAAGRVAGTGLGLAGAREIVERHGGTIVVNSEEGAGSTFVVRLPLPAGAQDTAAQEMETHAG